MVEDLDKPNPQINPPNCIYLNLLQGCICDRVKYSPFFLDKQSHFYYIGNYNSIYSFLYSMNKAPIRKLIKLDWFLGGTRIKLITLHLKIITELDRLKQKDVHVVEMEQSNGY